MLKVKIQSDFWKIHVLSDDKFENIFKESLAGITLTKDKTMYISESDFNIETLTHEMCHVYFYYCCTNAASLNADQIEEIWCELFALQGKDIINTSEKIFKALKKQL